MNNVVWLDRSELGLLKVTGETRTDLLHRMSTQDLRGMQAGQGRATVLTSEIGRIIDRLILFDRGDHLYMLTGENNADSIGRYLMRFVFFNDDFQIAPVTDMAIIGVYGQGAAELLAADLPLYGWQDAVHRVDSVAGDGYLLIVPEDERPQLVSDLTAKGVTEIDAAAFDALRVESAQPRFGHELTADYIPLETGLWDDVSFSKGCYIGQEIIARMESRGKLAKQLVALAAAAPVAVGSDILANDRKVGTITSAAEKLALGYVKTAALENKTPLATANGVELTIRLV